uniref:Uncharacterized protein n=1 Tax=uncultured marine virus TaxID=186617 RepID=A0A0F7L3Y8_9VIRU|nr:hypothetical protein [uncultured marine virus]
MFLEMSPSRSFRSNRVHRLPSFIFDNSPSDTSHQRWRSLIHRYLAAHPAFTSLTGSFVVSLIGLSLY